MTKNQLVDGIKAISVPLFLALMSCINVYAFVMAKTSQSAEMQKCRTVLEQSSNQLEQFRQLVLEMPTAISNYVNNITYSYPTNLAIASTRLVTSTDKQQRLENQSIRYHYMVLDGYPAIRYYGRNFGIGSPFLSHDTRIKQIFPDRILLSDGTVLLNTHNPDVEGSYFRQPSNPQIIASHE